MTNNFLDSSDKNKSQEMEWVNILKGLGIILVVVGHVFSGIAINYIYIFHMPLFFFLAGFLMKIKPRKKYFREKFLYLIIPYISFSLLFMALTIFLLAYNSQLTVKSFEVLLVKNFLGGDYLIGWQDVFWFVTVFFIAQQLLNFLLNLYSMKTIFYICCFSLLLAYLNDFFLSFYFPWAINVVLYALPIMFVGYAYKQKVVTLNFGVSVSVAVLMFILVYFFPKVFFLDLKYSHYGLVIINFLAAFSIINVLIYLSKLISFYSFSRIFSKIGKASMTIMFTHQFFAFNLKNHFENVFFIFIVVLLLSYIIHVILTYYATLSTPFLGVHK